MRSIFLSVATIAVIGFLALNWISEPRPAFPREKWADYEKGGDAARGRIAFFAGGCAACHATPGQPDRLRLGGGLAISSMVGTFYAPNISSHPTDGIGAWKVVDLANAMMSGVSPDGTHYYPVFPFTSFRRVKLEDIRDLMAFLRTLAPVAGKAREHDITFPLNIRRALGIWKLLFMDEAKFEADPSKSAQWNHGRYLVEGLGHCAECHSPRNFLGAIVADRRFTGGISAPDITQARSGIESWSRDDIAETLKSGKTPGRRAIGGAMADVVKDIGELPPSDREAMADYLKSLAARNGKMIASGPS